ncbi:PREDICTED: uncharacterized protein LOC108569565 [Nicrophorus vespilloides]|uniref:Uncharacterized protein LOC108569565 n=1 Tax=Nicrophorus vespilloides TaxID=110193 RepID=A0ABM1NIJ3_NICVS|nr:PREDICTED: uncharacterized protein LOC108569565 [Nicrophorus vespilloides]
MVSFIQDKDGIDLSKDLKEEINYTRIVKSLKRVQMFQILDDEVLLHISKIVQILGVQINSVIITTGQISPWLHILEKGQCLIYSTIAEKGKTVALTIESGASFPVIESMFRLPSLIYVETATHCQIMYIPIDKLLLVLEVHQLKYLFDPAKYDSIINYINLLDYQINWNSVDADASLIFLNKARIPIILKKKKCPHDFGKISFLRYLMLWKTINPQSKLYIGWEISRCILATIQLVINSYSLTILYEYSNLVFLCNVVLDVAGYIDIYIRLHVQYHNDKQILVTHPLYTAKHYLTTSFIVDLYGVLPYHIFQLHHLFFSDTLLTYYLHIIITRSMQMWRVFGGLNYMMSISKDKLLAVLRTAKIIVIYFISDMFFVNYVVSKVCVFEEHSMNCADYSLFKDTPDKGHDPIYIKSTISYVIVAFFTGTSTFFFKKMNVKQLGDYYFALMAMLSLRIYLMTYYIAILVAGHFSAVANRSQVKNFMDFAKKENVDDDSFTAVVKEYEHRWKQTNGLDFIKELESIQYEIRYKLLDFLFGLHIAAAPLFVGADESLIRLLTMNVNIEYFIRGSMILQMNDVQNKLYIVYRGIVEINIDDSNVLEVLGRGSIFGSFAKRGYTRQTINAKAVTHCELLYIDADVFNRLASRCPIVMNRIKRIRFLNQEYVMGGSSEDGKSDSNKRWMSMFSKRSIYVNWSTKINQYFNQESKWMNKIQYLFYMHYTPLSIVATTVVMVHTKCGNLSVLCLLIINYVIDIPFWIRLCANMTLQYTDKDTGHVIVDPSKIRHRYMHSYSFILDILILFPFEAFIYIFSAEFALIGLIPRIFRVIHFFMYYDTYRSTFNYETHICVFFYIYLNLTYVSFFSGIWSQLSCNDPCCFPERREAEGKDCLLVGWEMLFDGLIFSVNNIASSNLKVDPPDNTLKTIICMFSNFTAPFVVAIMLCSITNLFNACYFNQMLYFRTMDELLVNLKKQDLSPSLLDKTARFFTVMWNCARGENLPRLLQIASPNLREQVLMNIYGNHIQNHYLFADTHNDFIRQVVRTLEKIIYLPGYHIVRQGDNDGCMYIVNSGEVESRFLMKSGEMKTMYVLHTGNSFGEGSGLFNVAHQNTYVCRTIVEVLVLKREKWVFLWKWFPASYEMMLMKAREFQIDGCYQQQESNDKVLDIQMPMSSVM